MNTLPRLNYRDIQRIRARQRRNMILLIVGVFFLLGVALVLLAVLGARPAHGATVAQVVCVNAVRDDIICEPSIEEITPRAFLPVVVSAP